MFRAVERELKKRQSRKKDPATGQPDSGMEGQSKARGCEGAPCKSCNHPNRELLERMVLDGASWLSIQSAIAIGDKSVDPSNVAIQRHAQKCIPDIMTRRVETIQMPDNITAEMVMEHVRDSLRMAQQSAEMVFDEDEHGVVREAAQGRSAAIRTRVDCARAAGELIGLFDSKKIDLILRMPETQEMITKIVEAVCSGCALKVRELLAGGEQ